MIVTVKEIAAPDQENIPEEELPSPVDDFKEDGDDHALIVGPKNLPEGYTYVQYFKVTIEPEYIVTEGDDSEWTKGSGASFKITVKRLSQDDLCFEQFTGVLIDDEELTEGFEAEKGSTIITLDPETLENLAEGSHTLTIIFKDGEVATNLTIKAEESSSEAPQEESSESEAPPEESSEDETSEAPTEEETSSVDTTEDESVDNEDTNNPPTGVEDHLGVYLCMLIVSLMCFVAAYRYGDKLFR